MWNPKSVKTCEDINAGLQIRLVDLLMRKPGIKVTNDDSNRVIEYHDTVKLIFSDKRGAGKTKILDVSEDIEGKKQGKDALLTWMQLSNLLIGESRDPEFFFWEYKTIEKEQKREKIVEHIKMTIPFNAIKDKVEKIKDIYM